MLEMFLKGGVLMYPILLCSIVALAIILERSYVFWRLKRQNLFKKLNKIYLSIMQNELSSAIELALASPEDLLQELGHFLKYPSSRTAMEKALSHTGQKEIKRIERHLPMLASIANVAPLLGLLGTVTGMIKAFMVVQQMGSQVNAAMLAGGIWEAMLTTAFGLSVAIPSIIAYDYFINKANNYSSRLEDYLNSIINLLEKQGFFKEG